MRELTAQELRELVEESIKGSIEIHRGSRAASEGASYERPSGPPTEEEVDDFLASNPLLDEETYRQLVDPGFLGFSTISVEASDDEDWVRQFQSDVSDWANNNSWLAADLPWRDAACVAQVPESALWLPSCSVQPGWLSTAPSALLLAADLLRGGRLLSEMSWREFEKLIGALLEAEGWKITLTRPSKDGGIDVVSFKNDAVLGPVKALWQAKCYGPTRNVGLSQVRELSGIVEIERATKGFIVTTSHLTRGAVEWVRRDLYRLDYKDARGMDDWVRAAVFGDRSPQKIR